MEKQLQYGETLVVHAPSRPAPRWPQEVEDRATQLIEEAEWLEHVEANVADLKAVACALEQLNVYVAVEVDGAEQITRGRTGTQHEVAEWEPTRNLEEVTRVLQGLLLDLAAARGFSHV